MNKDSVSMPLLVAGGMLALVHGPAFAQQSSSSGELEEVVVTAERRAADVQNVAASVAVRSGEDLAREGKATVDQIIRDIPGISGTAFAGESAAATGAFAGDSPLTGVAVRGVRSNAGSIGLSQSATTAGYVDGVYNGVGGTYDIDRVEVLRGPQGTLYGRSATGGVIAFYTRDPNTSELEGDASVELGSQELRRIGGAVNVPLVDGKFAVRVSANQYRRQGYDYDYASGYSSKIDDARVKALFTPTENLSVLLGAALNNNTTWAGGARYLATSEHSWVRQEVPALVGSGELKSRQYWGKISWDLGPATLIYQPSVRTFEKYALLYPAAPTAGNYRERNLYPDDKFITHELQLTSNPGSTFVWQTGAIYFDNDATFASDYYRIESGNFALSREFNRKTKQYGIYGEATYPFTDSTRLTGGLRYDKTDVAASGVLVFNPNRSLNAGLPNAGAPVVIQTFTLSGPAGEREFKNTTYKVRLEHDLAEERMLYAMVSSAFIPGDVQVSTSSPPKAYSFDAETITAYEVGLKSRFLDNRLQINGALYYYDYGRQVNVEVVPGDPTNTVTLILPAKFKGLELETLYQLTEADRVGLDVAYVNAKYDDSPEWRAQYRYRELAGISPLTVRLSYNHEFTLPNSSKLRFGADARYADSYRVSDTAITIVPAVLEYSVVKSYIVSNVNLDWSSPDGRYGVGGYVRNIADERYKTSVAAPTTPTTANPRYFLLSEPRTYGVSFRVNF